MAFKDYSLSVLIKVINQFTRPLRDLSDQMSTVRNVSKRLADDFEGLNWAGDRIAKIGKKLSIGLTAPLVAIGTLSLKSAVSFDEAMGKIGVALVANKKRVKDVGDDILNLAQKYAVMPTEITAGVETLGRMFEDSSDLMKRADLAAKAARASVASMSDAASLASQIMTAYGDRSVEAMQKILNIATIARWRGMASFTGLADALSRVLEPAAAIGIKMEEITAAFTLLTRLSPLQASRAGFQLATMMETLAKIPGIKEEIQATGFPAFLDKLNRFLGDSTANIRQLFGGARAFSGALFLMKERNKGLPKLIDFINKNLDFTTQALDTQIKEINSAGFAWDRFRVQLEVARIKIGRDLVPTFERFINNVLDPMLSKFIGIDDITMKLTNILAGLAAITGPLTYGLGKSLRFLADLGIVLLTFKTLEFGVLLKGGALLGILAVLGKIALVIGSIAFFSAVIIKNWKDIKFIFRHLAHEFDKRKEDLAPALGILSTKAISGGKKVYKKLDISSKFDKYVTDRFSMELFKDYLKTITGLGTIEKVGRNLLGEIVLKVQNESDKNVTVDRIVTNPNSPLFNVYSEIYRGIGESY